MLIKEGNVTIQNTEHCPALKGHIQASKDLVTACLGNVQNKLFRKWIKGCFWGGLITW